MNSTREDTSQLRNGTAMLAAPKTPRPPLTTFNRSLSSESGYTPMHNPGGASRPPLRNASGEEAIMEEDSNDFWDQFEHIAEDDSKATDAADRCFGILARGVKVILCLLFFSLIAAGLLATRVAILAMTENFGIQQREITSAVINATGNSSGNSSRTISAVEACKECITARDKWSYTLLITVCFPYLWTFLQMLSKVAFGKHKRPSLAAIAWALVIECSHSVGLSIVLWRILPHLDVLQACLILSIVGVVPSLLACGESKNSERRAVRVVCVVLDVLSCILQIAGVIGSTLLLSNNGGSYWEVPLSAFLISLQQADNYLGQRADWLPVRLHSFTQWRVDQLSYRVKLYLLVVPVKVCLMFGLAFAFVPDMSPLHQVLEVVSSTPGSTWLNGRSYFLLIAMITPLMTFYFAYTSSQLHMQQFCYALPVTLLIPASCTLAALLSIFSPASLTFTLLRPAADVSVGVLLPACAFWLSQIWLTRHLWKPENLRLEKVDNLFVLPNFCTLMLDQSLAYNRMKQLESSSTTCHKETSSVKDCNEKTTPTIYICATMWHESKTEMIQMLKSILRLDEDQATKKHSNVLLNRFSSEGGRNPDSYEMEAHIMFDDAMKMNKNRERVLNDFVITLLQTVNEAASSLYNKTVELAEPVRTPTPYGGKLVYVLPGGNQMVVHLKDKNKIRHRKRWSQIMYMYYLLGYKNLLGVEQLHVKTGNKKTAEVFRQLPHSALEKSQNTYLLVLDGDVDFKPSSVQLLVDRMKKNQKVGVVCGRIHPIGSGPMVWYQRFEYAVGHWLQKAAEHVLGCVLCAPGCFSLFRASALMDDNVMKTYSVEASQARHYVQYDQGEDRWLSTLLLQRGYRIEYVAASDAFTFAPETFKEFFNQRRRWGPSTMANIMDLLTSWRHTVKSNSSISLLYIIYQLLIFVSSVLGPATIILLIAGASQQVFGFSYTVALLFSILPPLFYLIACFVTRPDTQISIAAVLSLLYALCMCAVAVGSVFAVAQQGLLSQSGIFIIGLSAVSVICAVLHPRECLDLFPGILYYLSIPSGYLLLIIYSMTNMNNVSWGTRETVSQPKKDTPEKPENFLHSLIDSQTKEDSLCNKLASFISQCCGSSRALMEDNSKTLHKILDRMDKLEKQQSYTEDEVYIRGQPHTLVGSVSSSVHPTDVPVSECAIYERNDLVNPAWMDCAELRRSSVQYVEEEEREFWEKLIYRYLKPIELDAAKEANLTAALKTMRNNICLAFFLLNALWITIIYTVQVRLPDIQDSLTVMYLHFGQNRSVVLEPLTLLFLLVFAVTLALQFLAMLWHRWATVRHIMAATELDFNCCNKQLDSIKEATAIARQLQTSEEEETTTDPMRRQVSLHRQFDKRLTALAKEFDTDDYANLPARQWHKGHSKGQTDTLAPGHKIQQRIRRLSTARPRHYKPATAV